MPARTCTREELEQFTLHEWDSVAPAVQLGIRRTIEHVLEKQDSSAVSREQWLQLANADGDDLLGLLAAANALRSELVGNIVTYVVNRKIGFPNNLFIGPKLRAFRSRIRDEAI